MNSVLFVNACFRPGSRTLVLAKRVLEKLNGQVEEVNLEKEAILPLDAASLAERDALIQAGDYTSPLFRYARQYAQADVIVVAAPCWDLSFPAALKAYFEAIMVLGITFRYTPQGIPVGLCKAKELIYVTTAGGPLSGNDLGFQYVEALAKVYHSIPGVRCFAAENLDIVGADVKKILEKALEEIDRM